VIIALASINIQISVDTHLFNRDSIRPGAGRNLQILRNFDAPHSHGIVAPAKVNRDVTGDP